MPDAAAAPAENGTADGAAAEHSAAPAAAESVDAATPMETEVKGAEAVEVVKKKRTKKHAVPYRAQGVAGLSDKAVQVGTTLAHAQIALLLTWTSCMHSFTGAWSCIKQPASASFWNPANFMDYPVCSTSHPL